MSPHSLVRSPTSVLKQAALGFLAILILIGHSLAAVASPSKLPEESTEEQAAIVIADIDVLALSEDFKTVLETRIRPIKRTQQRAEALHELLFGLDSYDIRYHEDHTGTAMETMNKGSGNCISLANLFVAAARHVGLPAQYQVVEVEEDWSDREDDLGYYIVAGHINVLVDLGSRREMTVEFLQTFQGRSAKTHLIPDDEALAQYYNNLGMMKLGEGEPAFAHAYIRKALDTYDRSALAWSNMGVLEKRQGNYAAAENAYLKALQYDRKSLTATQNLYVLYTQRNQAEKAKPYAAVVEKYNRRNPYYLNKLASNAMDEGEYGEAIKLLKKAIKIKDTEDKFYFSLAKAYYYSGDMKRSTEAMEKAEDAAEEPTDQERYQRKLEALAAVANR